jgi:GlcNAc-P-P-Und epimerase
MPHIIMGGNGFIGKHLSNYLMQVQEISTTVDIVDSDTNKSETVLTDVRDIISINIKHVQGDTLFNLAAIHKTPGHLDSEYFETNISGAENVCAYARRNRIDTIVFTSSIAPYGAGEDEKLESSMPMPNTPYGISKYIAEEVHRRWQAEDPSNRKLIIVRPGVVFGKGEGGNFTRLYKTLSKRLFMYPGRNDTKKAAIYVKDLVRIMFEMSRKESPGNHIFNMCYPEPHTIRTIVSEISSVTGVSKNVPTIPGWMLRSLALLLYLPTLLIGGRQTGFHPDRVKKLMISTNISGQKLENSSYSLKYSLKDALEDWFSDCNRSELN